MTTPLNIKSLARVVIDALKRKKAPQEIDMIKVRAILTRFDRRSQSEDQPVNQI